MRRDSNSQPFNRELSWLPTRPDLRPPVRLFFIVTVFAVVLFVADNDVDQAKARS